MRMYTLFKRVRADISMRGIGKMDSSILTKPGVCVRACVPVRVFTHTHTSLSHSSFHPPHCSRACLRLLRLCPLLLALTSSGGPYA